MKNEMKKIIFWCYGSICEPYLEEALGKVGSVCKFVTPSQEMEYQPADVVEKLCQKIASCQPDFVFSINFFCDVSNVCEKMGVKYVAYTVDVPVNTLFCKELGNSCNEVFMFDKMQYKKFKNRNENGTYYLPLGASVSSMQQTITNMPENVKKKYQSDVAFVGSLYEEKDNLKKFFPYLSDKTKGYIDGIINVQKNLPIGNILAECLTDNLINELVNLCPELQMEEERKRYLISHYLLGMHLAATERKEILEYISGSCKVKLYTQSDVSNMKNVYFAGTADSYKEMPVIFSESKINLNITYRAIETGIPQRVWDVCGCGGFLITNFQEELTDYFEIGKELECYESKEDLLEKIQFYLKYDEIRKEIAENGFLKVKKYHTYDKRVEHMMNTIGYM